jgi:hypothetical protein
MIAAPRGIDMTMSVSSGRSARCSTPTVFCTTEPSGRPMIASCSIAPRWVWNTLPGSRKIVFIRPFGPVS